MTSLSILVFLASSLHGIKGTRGLLGKRKKQCEYFVLEQELLK